MISALQIGATPSSPASAAAPGLTGTSGVQGSGDASLVSPAAQNGAGQADFGQNMDSAWHTSNSGSKSRETDASEGSSGHGSVHKDKDSKSGEAEDAAGSTGPGADAVAQVMAMIQGPAVPVANVVVGKNKEDADTNAVAGSKAVAGAGQQFGATLAPSGQDATGIAGGAAAVENGGQDAGDGVVRGIARKGLQASGPDGSLEAGLSTDAAGADAQGGSAVDGKKTADGNAAGAAAVAGTGAATAEELVKDAAAGKGEMHGVAAERVSTSKASGAVAHMGRASGHVAGKANSAAHISNAPGQEATGKSVLAGVQESGALRNPGAVPVPVASASNNKVSLVHSSAASTHGPADAGQAESAAQVAGVGSNGSQSGGDAGSGSGSDASALMANLAGTASVAPVAAAVQDGSFASAMGLHGVAGVEGGAASGLGMAGMVARGEGAGRSVADQMAAAGSAAVNQASAAAPIQSARVLQSMQGTEMKVGMHSAEFGAISVSTTVSNGGVSAQITLDHSALGKTLEGHAAGLEQKLGDSLGMNAKVEIRDAQTAGGDAGQSAGQQSGQSHSNGQDAWRQGGSQAYTQMGGDGDGSLMEVAQAASGGLDAGGRLSVLA